MRSLRFLPLCFTFAAAVGLSSCSSEPPVEKAIVGTWIQETPVSMSSNGLQTTTSDTVLKLDKNGSIHLTRNLELAGRGMPDGGVKISLELRGQWTIENGRLKQIQETALIMPITADDTSRQLADEFQSHADGNAPTIKKIIAVDRKQLILEDLDTSTTDIYRRK